LRGGAGALQQSGNEGLEVFGGDGRHDVGPGLRWL
jgi:hypothetical protein